MEKMEDDISALLKRISERANDNVRRSMGEDVVLTQAINQSRQYYRENQMEDEQPIIQEPVRMVRQEPIETGRKKYVIQYKYGDEKFKTVDEDYILNNNPKIGDKIKFVHHIDSDQDDNWTIVDIVDETAYPNANMMNIPVRGVSYSPSEDVSIQNGGNCLITSLYYAFGYDKTIIGLDRFVDDIIKSFNLEKLDWTKFYDISQAEFKQNIINKIPMECCIDFILPYLKRKNKKIEMFIDTDEGLMLIKKLLFGKTDKKTRAHNLAYLTFSDSHIGRVDNIRNYNRLECKNVCKVPETTKYDPPKIFEQIELLFDSEPLIIDVIEFINNKNDIIIKKDYMFYNETQWIKFIYNVEDKCSQLKNGKRPVVVKRMFARDERYLKLRISVYKNKKNKLIINVNNPYSLLNKEGLVLTDDKHTKICELHNNLLEMFDGCSKRATKYNSSFNMDMLKFMTNNIKAVPRAIIGGVEYHRRGYVPFNIDMSKAYPSAIVAISGCYIPKYSSDACIMTGINSRPYDLVLCRKTNTEEPNYFYKGLDSMLIQNDYQLVFQFQLDEYTKLTERTPYRIIGVYQYSDLVKYDEDKKIYKAYEELINQGDKDLKLMGNKMTGMMEKSRKDKCSRLYTSLTDISAYCSDYGIPFKNIISEKINMEDETDEVFYCKIGTSRILKSQMITKLLIHSIVNMVIIRECLVLKKNYNANIDEIRTDGIKCHINPNQKMNLIKRYTPPENKSKFDLIGKFYYEPVEEPQNEETLNDKIIEWNDDTELSENIDDIPDNHFNTIPSKGFSSLLSTIIPHKIEPVIIDYNPHIEKIEIDETRMKNDKDYFMEVLNRKKFLIIEGEPGVGKDYCINKHIPETHNLTAFNTLARDFVNGSTVHSFLGIGIEGDTKNKKCESNEHINFSDIGLVDEQLYQIIIGFIEGRIKKGLLTTATIDIKRQLPNIVKHNSQINKVNKYRLLSMGTVVEYKQQERIKDPKDKQMISELTKLLDAGEDPYNTLKKYIKTKTIDEVITMFNPSEDIIIVQTNDRRDYINNRIIETHFGGMLYDVGMRMLYNGENDIQKKIYKKDEFIIKSISKNEIVLNQCLNNQNDLIIDITEMKKNFIYGFTITAYSIQGKTIYKGKTFIDNPSHPLLSYDGKSAIVAISRNVIMENNILIENDKNYNMFENGELNKFLKEKGFIEEDIKRIIDKLGRKINCGICGTKLVPTYYNSPNSITDYRPSEYDSKKKIFYCWSCSHRSDYKLILKNYGFGLED